MELVDDLNKGTQTILKGLGKHGATIQSSCILKWSEYENHKVQGIISTRDNKVILNSLKENAVRFDYGYILNIKPYSS